MKASETKLELGEFSAECDGESSLAPALHTAVVSAFIEGASADPESLEVEIDLRCDDEEAAGPSATSQGEASPSEASDGCSTRTGRQGNASTLLGWLSVLGVALVRRTRARRAL